MEFLSGLLSCSIWPLLCTSLGKQYKYIRKLDEHKESLRNVLERLKSRGNDINDELNRGRLQHGKHPKKEVTFWLEDWQKLVNAIENMDTENGNGMCLRGLCPNCYSRLKQSKRIEKLISDVKGLLENCRFSDGLFSASLPENQDSLPATDIHGSTAERKRDEILWCIRDPEVSKIGVYGMGGVGKTTIMTNIHNQLKETREFDIVIWVTVSSSFNLEKLQDMIAKQLGCDLSSSLDETSRATVLHAAFRRRRNFLIIFDDVWDNISLGDVGIPEPNRENRSRIVWTTRSIRVCNSMESQREIKVEGLFKEEAWSLFKNKVGGEDVISPEIEPIAKEVAEECGGVPLALITVGRALRKTYQLEVWRNALQELRSSSTEQIEGMEEEVFRRLKFSYNRLSNDKVRECFLYCALYPEDCRIRAHRLIECWMVEGLIVEVGSWEREKDKGHAILKELEDACMIEINMDEYYVKMHDLIRDLAIIITREQPRFIVKPRLWLTKSPKEEEWAESLERVSLMSNKIEKLDGQPNCPRLLTLFLHNNFNLNNISHTFFKHMHNLRVLNLSQTYIELLPDALSDLTNLHALLLQSCKKLKCLPSLAKLHKLRVLDLNSVPLEEVPHGLENLVKLRHLDISEGEGLRSFPPGMLSKCTNLEHLFLRESGWRWPYSNEDDKDKATIAEIISLENLTMFSIEFSNVTSFNSYSKSDRWKLLKKSNFGIGGSCISGGFDQHSMCLKNSDLKNMSGIMLPSIIQSFVIIKCDLMEWIEEDGQIGFPNFQKLELSSLLNFRGLCKQKAQQEALRNLRDLSISDCHQLKWLIPYNLLQNNLQNLKVIDVHKCNGMKEIISCETGLTPIILPKLELLIMRKLPMLTSVCPGKLVCDSLSRIGGIECPNLKKFPFSIDKVPPALMEIKWTKEWWNSLEWDDPHLKHLLQPLCNTIE